MPSLKDLHCFIELPDGKVQLKEFGATYGDGWVETFVAVPDRPQPFAIRLTSSKFIAPGLAMYVFIDGVYQCNRNRQGLKLRKPPDKKSLVDFVVRQKEERQDDGSMIARDWRFEKLDIVSANEAPEACSPKVLENIGCIEVVVLRCAGSRSAKSAPASATKAKPMNLDGAGDIPDHPYGLDGGHYEWNAPQIDDRGWQHIHRGRASGYGAPTRSTSQYYNGPPPPLPHSQLSRGVQNSPVTVRSSPPPGRWYDTGDMGAGYRYGTGPIPRQSRAPSHAYSPSATSPNRPFDSERLDKALKEAVKKGIESYQASSQVHAAPGIPPAQPSSQLPGSWPSPFGPTQPLLVTPVQNAAPSPVPPPPITALGLQSPPPNTHISWDQHLPKPSKEWNDGKGWDSGEEENETDSWDTEGTWDAKQDKNGWEDPKPEHSRERTPNGWEASASPAARTNRTGHQSRSSDFQTARSRPRESVWESGIDGDGWTHIDVSSESTTDTWASKAESVHPSESISVAVPAAGQDPLADLLSRKLRNLKHDEMRRRSVTGPAATWDSPASQMNRPRSRDDSLLTGLPPYSTLEQAVRGTASNMKVQLAWGADHTKANPASRVTADKNLTSPDSWQDTFSTKNNNAKHEIATFDQDTENNGDWSAPVKKTPQDDHWGKSTKKPPQDDSWDESPRKSRQKDGWGANDAKKPSAWSTAPQKNKDKDDWEAKPSSWDIPSKPQVSIPAKLIDHTARDTTWQAALNGWAATQKAKSLANEANAWAADQASKPRHSKHQQKPSRQFPVPEKKPTPTVQDGPLKVRKEDAAKKGVEHHVRAGKSTPYGHAIGRPEYLDSLEKPYATFRFKYRSHAMLRKLLGTDVVPSSPGKLVVNPADPFARVLSATNPAREIKQQLKGLPKEKLIDELLELNKKLEKEKEKMEGEGKTEIVGRERTEDWVKRHSSQASEKGKKDGGWGGKKDGKDDDWAWGEMGGW